MSAVGPVAQAIRTKLENAFAPETLTIRDESYLHAGHAGHNPGGESHFAVTIASASFTGKSRLERQRMVYGVLAEEMKGRIHALRLTLTAPGEI